MNKPRFNIYTKIKTNPTPFLYSNQPSLTTNIAKKKKKLTPLISLKNSPHYHRCTTPLNKISSSTQVNHNPSQLPLIGIGIGKGKTNQLLGVSRKLNFTNVKRSKTPNQTNHLNNSSSGNYRTLTNSHSQSQSLSHPNSNTSTIMTNSNVTIQKELQIIFALKKQIKAQNETIYQYTKEITEMKKMRNISYVKELKAENSILHNQIDKMKKLLEGMNSESLIAIEAIDGLECNTAVEIQQMRVIKLLKEENSKLSLALFGLSQDKKVAEGLKETINQYENEIKALRDTNEDLNKNIIEKDMILKSTIEEKNDCNGNANANDNDNDYDKVKDKDNNNVEEKPIELNNNQIKSIAIPKLLSNEEKEDIDYLLKQILIAKGINWSMISQRIKDFKNFDNIERTLIQTLKLLNEDKWILRRYFVDLSKDNDSQISFAILNEQLRDLFNTETITNTNNNNRELSIDNNKVNILYEKCEEDDKDNKGLISFKHFRAIFNRVFNMNTAKLLWNKEFASMIRLMKSTNTNLSLIELDYKAIESYLKENKSNNKDDIDQLFNTQKLLIEEDAQIIQNPSKQDLNQNPNQIKQIPSISNLLINQIELVSLLTSYLITNSITFQSFLLPLDNQIANENNTKSLLAIDFIDYLQSSNIIQKNYSIVFDNDFLIKNHLWVNLTKLEALFSPSEDNRDENVNVNRNEASGHFKTLTFKPENDVLNGVPLISKEEDPNENYHQFPFEYEQAKTLVNEIFETTLHRQYLNRMKDKEKSEVFANKMIDDIFAKVKENYCNEVKEKEEAMH